jgi:uncharacterized protein RhaS with RHS repeats
VTKYEYDPVGRNTAEKWLDGGGQVTRTLTYTHDKLGQLTAAADPAAAYSNFCLETVLSR